MTDDAPFGDVLLATGRCAASWQRDVRLLGNVRAGDMARACAEALDEIDRLRRGWLRVIQQENSCTATGQPCAAKRCGCHAEQEMLVKEGNDAR